MCFDALSLRIAHGEHTAMLGPNGAGKSSFIRMLTLDDRPRANGQRHAADAPVRTFIVGPHGASDAAGRRDRRPRRRTSASAPRAAASRGLDVALSGLLGSHGVFSHHEVTDEMREQARAALDRVEALHLAAKPLNEMSAGERRRVLIARALITRAGGAGARRADHRARSGRPPPIHGVDAPPGARRDDADSRDASRRRDHPGDDACRAARGPVVSPTTDRRKRRSRPNGCRTSSAAPSPSRIAAGTITSASGRTDARRGSGAPSRGGISQ